MDPWVGKIPWRRAWQPTPVFLPGESHGQRSLAGYSPWGGKESDTTERLTHTHTHTHTQNIRLCEVSSVGMTFCILQIKSPKVKELHMISPRTSGGWL